MKKKISFMDLNADIWNAKFKLNLLKDSDGDGKYDWIDCAPHDKTRQDKVCQKCGAPAEYRMRGINVCGRCANIMQTVDEMR